PFSLAHAVKAMSHSLTRPPATLSSVGREGRGALPSELSRNGFFPILIVILLLISKNLSRARLRLGLRLRACQCGPAAGLNSMAVHPGPLPHPGENVPNFVRALRP